MNEELSLTVFLKKKFKYILKSFLFLWERSKVFFASFGGLVFVVLFETVSHYIALDGQELAV